MRLDAKREKEGGCFEAQPFWLSERIFLFFLSTQREGDERPHSGLITTQEANLLHIQAPKPHAAHLELLNTIRRNILCKIANDLQDLFLYISLKCSRFHKYFKLRVHHYIFRTTNNCKRIKQHKTHRMSVFTTLTNKNSTVMKIHIFKPLFVKNASFLAYVSKHLSPAPVFQSYSTMRWRDETSK